MWRYPTEPIYRSRESREAPRNRAQVVSSSRIIIRHLFYRRLVSQQNCSFIYSTSTGINRTTAGPAVVVAVVVWTLRRLLVLSFLDNHKDREFTAATSDREQHSKYIIFLYFLFVGIVWQHLIELNGLQAAAAAVAVVVWLSLAFLIRVYSRK
jgi:hypothetical protein